MTDSDITRKEIINTMKMKNILYEVRPTWHRITDPFEGAIVFSESKNATDAYIRTDEDSLLELKDHR